MGEDEREPLLFARGASALSHVSGGEDEAAVADKKTSSQCLRRRENQHGFNLLFVRRFLRLVRVVFPSVCCKSLLLLAMLVLTQSAEEYNIYLAGLIPSKFIYALDTKDMSMFKTVLWMSTVTVIAVSICKSAGLLVAGLLYVRGRGMIVRHLHKHYFRGISYYHINITDHSIDNPDQRITQDVDKFCDQVTQVLPNILLSPAIIAYYTYKTFQSMGYLGPLCIYAYFVVSSVINKLIMSSIAPLVVRQEKYEGDFRYHHTQVRTNAESIAFYKGGNIEAEKSNNLLKVLLKTQLSVVHWQFPLNLSTGIFDYTAAIISYCLVGAAVFSGEYDGMSVSQLSATISKNAFFSMYLLNNFSTVVDTAVKFSEIVGYTHRIGELVEFLDQVWHDQSRGSSGCLDKNTSTGRHSSINNSHQSCPVVSPGDDVGFLFEDLSVAPPHQSSPLIEGLNLKLKKGDNILVLGDTGCGKSSILRVLRGLWRPVRGCASICCEDSPRSILFLPQKSYLTRGSLLDQVTFPEKPKQLDSSWSLYQSNASAYGSRICEALSLAGLVNLVQRLGGVNGDTVENWCDIVSPGEMQKIGFARLFYHQPQYAVLDEATSSLSEEDESSLYSALSQLDITVLSIGHRSTLQKFHSHKLHIYSGNNWTLQEIHKHTENCT